MITLYVSENNPITQNFYDDLVDLNLHRLTCSCGHAGCLSKHARYYRHLTIEGDKVPFEICRVRCSVCGKTHAILNNGTPCQDTKPNFYHEPFFDNCV